MICVSRRCAVVELNHMAEQISILDAKKFLFKGVEVFFQRWTPRLDTIPSRYVRPRSQWVSFFGVPYHLMTYEVVVSL